MPCQDFCNSRFIFDSPCATNNRIYSGMFENQDGSNITFDTENGANLFVHHSKVNTDESTCTVKKHIFTCRYNFVNTGSSI